MKKRSIRYQLKNITYSTQFFPLLLNDPTDLNDIQISSFFGSAKPDVQSWHQQHEMYKVNMMGIEWRQN